MQPIRQGDVILLPVQQSEAQKLSHLTLAEGEVTGHKHRISEEQAELSEKDGTLYLRVLSEIALLSHNVDIEPIYLLKMICPSTEFIHVLRIPPDIHSASETIRWVNWGTDPE